MTKERELVKNTVIILIGKVCTQLISLLMLPLYTHVLPSDEYGLVDLITTYVALALPLIGFQIEMGAFRYILDNRKDEKRKTAIISNSLVTITGSTLFFLVIFLIVSRFVTIPYLPFVILCVVATLYSHFMLQVARGLGDNLGYSIGCIITGVTTVGLNLIFLLILKTGISGILLATAIANLANVLFLLIREKAYKNIKVSTVEKNEIAALLKYSMPLVPNSLIWWIINVSDRTLITIFIDMSANGVYAVANTFSNIISQVYGVFNLSWTESASLHIEDEDRDTYFSSTFNQIIKIFSSIALLMIAGMPILFLIVGKEEYFSAYNYIPILLIGMFFNIVVTFIGAIYIAKKKTKEVAITSLWAGVLNVIINVSLIHFIGVWAAALSTLMSFLIMSVYRYRDVQKYVSLKLSIRAALLNLLIAIPAVALYYMHSIYMTVLNVLMVGAYVVLIWYKDIGRILRKKKAE